VAGVDMLFMGMMITCGVFTFVYATAEDPSLRSKSICIGLYLSTFAAEKYFPETAAMLLMQVGLCLFYAFWFKLTWFN
jgi:hypothetical protein